MAVDGFDLSNEQLVEFLKIMLERYQVELKQNVNDQLNLQDSLDLDTMAETPKKTIQGDLTNLENASLSIELISSAFCASSF